MQTYLEELKERNATLGELIGIKTITVKYEATPPLKYLKKKINGRIRLYQLPIYPDVLDLSERPF